MPEHQKIIQDVGEYYAARVAAHGATPQGADWNSLESQTLRFDQLAMVIGDAAAPFSVIDYGCGYGALLEYLKKRHASFSYTGFDISEKMITQAQLLYPGESWAQWQVDESRLAPADYVVASGIFNVRLSHGDTAWRNYILDTLGAMNRLSTKGIAFNMLTSYSDREYMKDYLYYADPSFYFNYCKVTFSKYVSLLHDYPLYEFTLLVRK